jgi:RNA polymerase sigma-70 factor (ECF subfamily)
MQTNAPTRLDGGFDDAGSEEQRSFLPTQSGIVRAAGRGDQEALASLCQRYWYPIYAFLRRIGTGPLDARDVTQGIFARLLAPGHLGIERVDLRRGRFRGWLRACAKHYLWNELERERARRHRDQAGAICVDAGLAEDRFQQDAGELVPAGTGRAALRIIDRELALMVVDRALARLREKCRTPEMLFHFEELQAGVKRAAGAPDQSDEDLAARFGTKATNLRKNRWSVRNRFRELLRDEVSAMVSDPASIDDELLHLRNAL